MHSHLAVDRRGSISATEKSNLNHRDSIIFSCVQMIHNTINICHILMTECVGSPVNLGFLLGHVSDEETVIMALPDI